MVAVESKKTMLRFKCLILSTLLLWSIGLAALPPRSSQAQGDLFIQVLPAEIQQGRTGLVRVLAPNEIARLEMIFDQRQIPLYRSAEGDWVGFLSVDMEAGRGEQSIDVYAWIGTTRRDPQRATVRVVWGAFDYQDIILPNSMGNLLDPNINRDENTTLVRAYSRRTPQKLWDGTFQNPVPGDLISTFGGIRSYNNGVYSGRHTGADFRAALNEPIRAAGTGRVVFVGYLPVRGNHIIVDHGWGVLTGYSHLSEVYVVPGQRVMAGDILGGAGTTGRSQGVHMHFELVVNGLWVDPIQFMSLAIPPALLDLTQIRSR
jgi:hypothetical protein